MTLRTFYTHNFLKMIFGWRAQYEYPNNRAEYMHCWKFKRSFIFLKLPNTSILTIILDNVCDSISLHSKLRLYWILIVLVYLGVPRRYSSYYYNSGTYWASVMSVIGFVCTHELSFFLPWQLFSISVLAFLSVFPVVVCMFVSGIFRFQSLRELRFVSF